MKSASIGTRGASQSRLRKTDKRRAGFTLLEALVALALVLAFAAALGPYLYQARQIAANGERRVAAHILLRSLLEAPFDRASLANAAREGEAGGLRWRIAAEPIVLGTTVSRERLSWSAFRVTASVSWMPRQGISAETVRLGKSE